MGRLFLSLEVGGEADHDELLETLARYGYTREDLIASPGEYAWRGGIVDVFSPWEANPFRIEFDGSRVASLREFDISNQRSLKRIERLTIPGLREFPATPEFLDRWKAAARKRSQRRHPRPRRQDRRRRARRLRAELLRPRPPPRRPLRPRDRLPPRPGLHRRQSRGRRLRVGRSPQGAPRPVRRPSRRPRLRPRSRRDLPAAAPPARPQGGRPLRGARRPGPQEGLSRSPSSRCRASTTRSPSSSST